MGSCAGLFVLHLVLFAGFLREVQKLDFSGLCLCQHKNRISWSITHSREFKNYAKCHWNFAAQTVGRKGKSLSASHALKNQSQNRSKTITKQHSAEEKWQRNVANTLTASRPSLAPWQQRLGQMKRRGTSRRQMKFANGSRREGHPCRNSNSFKTFEEQKCYCLLDHLNRLTKTLSNWLIKVYKRTFVELLTDFIYAIQYLYRI